MYIIIIIIDLNIFIKSRTRRQLFHVDKKLKCSDTPNTIRNLTHLKEICVNPYSPVTSESNRISKYLCARIL